MSNVANELEQMRQRFPTGKLAIDWDLAEEIIAALREKIDAPIIPKGWVLVPVEPSGVMLDRAVTFALNVHLTGDYGWTSYMRDLWATMITPCSDHEPIPKTA